jgi:hypothetical protein
LGVRKAYATPIVLIQNEVSLERLTYCSFALGSFGAAVHTQHANDRQPVVDSYRAWLADFDLLEPFSRIREAIQEAQRSVRQAA